LSAAEGQDDRQVVRDLIPLEGHLYPVGRLDYDSEGLILMTNDGELTNKLTHPRYGHEKEYRVLVARRPDEKQFEAWRRGVVLDDGDKTAPAEVSFLTSSGKGAWIRVVMGEGKKRQIREVGRLLGLPVVKIIRLRIGTLKLGSLKPRQWRHLTENEVLELKEGKGKLVEVRNKPFRDTRLHPTDRPKRVNVERPKLGLNEKPRSIERPARTPNDQSRKKDRADRGRSDRSRTSTRSRSPKR
jgi:23S rRNA pseudouridine2605 synthase